MWNPFSSEHLPALDPDPYFKKKRRGTSFPASILLLLFFLPIHKGFTQLTEPQVFDSLKVNEITANVNELGNFGGEVGNNNYRFGLRFPNSSGPERSFLFANALLVGGYTPSDELRMSGDRFYKDDFHPGPVADDYSLAYNAKYQQVWKMDRDSIQYHLNHVGQTGYQPPQMIQNWPAHGDTTNGEPFHLAPFKDVNGNGVYEPQLGEKPIMRGDKAIYFMTNDIRGPHDSTDAPLGIEVHGMIYAFDCPNIEALDHSILVHYDLINRSSISYDSLMIGQWSDYDIGCSSDDYIGSDVERGIAFGYNGDGYDEDCSGANGYHDFPPAAGNVFLKGPELPPNNIDDEYGGPGKGSVNGVGFGDGVPDNEHWGMQHAYNYNNSLGPTGDPETDQQYHNYMSGSWKDGTLVTYGGDGYRPSVTPSDTLARFMFPNDSDPHYYSTYGDTVDPWTEETAGNQPGDRRVMASTGPVTLPAGDTVSLDMAYVVAQEPDSLGNNTAPISNMKELADELRGYFLANSVPCSDGSFSSLQERKAASFEVDVYPNPSRGRFNVELEEGSSKPYRYELYSMRGALIKEGSWQGGGKKTLELSSERSGIHFLRIRSGAGSKVLKLVKR